MPAGRLLHWPSGMRMLVSLNPAGLENRMSIAYSGTAFVQ